MPVTYQQTSPGTYTEYGQYGGTGTEDYAFPHADNVNTGQGLLGFPIFGAPSTAPAVAPRTATSTGGVSHVTTNPAIVSSTGVASQFNDASNQLDSITSTPDPYAGLVQTQIQNELANNAATQNAAISSATARSANSENLNNNSEASTLYGIRAEDAANGTAQLNPEGQQMALSAATQSYQAKFNALDQAEKVAIANATAARNNADTKTMNEQLDYIKYIQQQKQVASEQAWKEYAFSNLSADQRAALGIQEQNAGIAASSATGTTQTTKPNFLQSLSSIFTGNPVVSTSTKIPGTPNGSTQSYGGYNYVYNGTTQTWVRQ